MTESANRKSKAGGCGSIVGLGLVLMLSFLGHRCTITNTTDMSLEEVTAFQQEVDQIRAHFQAGDCDRLYQDFIQPVFSDVSSTDFAALCADVTNDYETVESATLQSAACETTQRPATSEEVTYCTLEYRLSRQDGTAIREVYSWLIENGQRQLVEMNWSDSSAG
ncbi:MAG: hypothetical protein F6K00_29670 [Leptolyngbya sp. SIOISBB]|nr:hypothetical protein [Leptolyngbya sp. SIOISBB]